MAGAGAAQDRRGRLCHVLERGLAGVRKDKDAGEKRQINDSKISATLRPAGFCKTESHDLLPQLQTLRDQDRRRVPAETGRTRNPHAPLLSTAAAAVTNGSSEA